ncbi:hypothetical protein BJV78DRAFT_1209715 [Lactifluus subvellereus]|nr:hypothetical protein BJV78DRAFT_1209715 [Lactifluus subvellereus]
MAQLVDEDPRRQLNDYLQGHPAGNLGPLLSWEVSRTGPDHQAIFHVTARFRGVEIGYGEGISIGSAKRVAAGFALRYLRDVGVPGFSAGEASNASTSQGHSQGYSVVGPGFNTFNS